MKNKNIVEILSKDIIAENVSQAKVSSFYLSIRKMLFQSVPLENKMAFYRWLTKKYFDNFGLEILGDETRILRRKAFNRRMASKNIDLKIRTYRGQLVLVPSDYDFTSYERAVYKVF